LEDLFMEDVINKAINNKEEIGQQLKGTIGELRAFVEDQAKAHPLLFFAGAFAVGILASQPRILGLIARTALGVASIGGPLKSDSMKGILKGASDATQKVASAITGERSSNNMMTHH
jgi:hypothetical protein